MSAGSTATRSIKAVLDIPSSAMVIALGNISKILNGPFWGALTLIYESVAILSLV